MKLYGKTIQLSKKSIHLVLSDAKWWNESRPPAKTKYLDMHPNSKYGNGREHRIALPSMRKKSKKFMRHFNPHNEHHRALAAKSMDDAAKDVIPALKNSLLNGFAQGLSEQGVEGRQHRALVLEFKQGLEEGISSGKKEANEKVADSSPINEDDLSEDEESPDEDERGDSDASDDDNDSSDVFDTTTNDDGDEVKQEDEKQLPTDSVQEEKPVKEEENEYQKAVNETLNYYGKYLNGIDWGFNGKEESENAKESSHAARDGLVKGVTWLLDTMTRFAGAGAMLLNPAAIEPASQLAEMIVNAIEKGTDKLKSGADWYQQMLKEDPDRVKTRTDAMYNYSRDYFANEDDYKGYLAKRRK